jgi:hypothetical protein
LNPNGDADIRRNLARSIDAYVDFSGGSRLAEALADHPEVLDALLEAHPDGSAHFWGAPGNDTYDRYFREMRPGDVVVFTKGSRIWAVGRVAVPIVHPEFGRALWNDGDREFPNAYSLEIFTMVDVPVAPLNLALGNKSPDHPGHRQVLYDLTNSEIAYDVLVHEKVALPGGPLGSVAFDRAEAAIPGATYAEPGERRHAPTPYTVPERQVMMQHLEWQLVDAYRAALRSSAQSAVPRGDGWEADLLVTEGDVTDLIEAKSASSRSYVRQCLAQILDYAPRLDRAPGTVTGLFPTRPTDDLIGLLHRYGIDCVYVRDGAFVREAAPGGAGAIRAFWGE